MAVKVLEALDEAERIERFKQEIAVLEDSEHPHIIEVLGRGEYSVQGRLLPFFVMEYQPRNLDREIYAHPHGLHPDLVLPLCLQMASALVYLHAKNIIHRDLKPSNILFDGSNVKLADFGIAALGDTSGLHLIATPEGQKLGPHFYMSPEQWHRWKSQSRDRAGAPTDIFQMGLIMYQMLSGFNPNTIWQWQGEKRSSPATKIRDMDRSLVNDLVGLVREMLSIEPENRPTAERVQERLFVAFRAHSSHFTALYGVRPGREF